MKKQVILIGGFHKTRYLALSLLKKGYKVTAVNNHYPDCEKLAEMKALTVIHGDGTRPYVLEEALTGGMDIAIALTQKDEENLVICELCKKKFGVGRTVALVNDPKKTEFFYQMGVDSVVCAITVVAEIIEQQAFMDAIAERIPIGEGRGSITEIHITNTSPAAGKRLWEISLPGEVIIGCILRGEKIVIPRGDTRILLGDTVLMISASGEEENAIRDLRGR